MKVFVKLYGQVRWNFGDYPAKGEIQLEFADQIIVKDLIYKLQIPNDQNIVVSINGHIRKEDYPVEDMSKVNIFSLISGG